VREKDRNDYMKDVSEKNDNLTSWWRTGILIAYTFLIFFIIWVGYRIILLAGAYQAGDLSFIRAELVGYAIIGTIYFGIGGLLRFSRII